MVRDDNGQLCNLSQAADLLAQWIQEVYAGPSTSSKAMVWPFEATELKSVFQTFAASKALVRMYLPSLVWKHFATGFSQVIHQQATAWADSQGAPPAEWGQGTLVFLTKPNKPANCPQNLRPIAALSLGANVVWAGSVNAYWMQHSLDSGHCLSLLTFHHGVALKPYIELLNIAWTSGIFM